MKRAYPVIFTQTENVILIEVPDWKILTEGKDMVDAIEMARDAIGVAGISKEDAGEEIPEATEMLKIKEGTFTDEGKNFVSMVDIDFDVYRRKVDNKMVRRNVTIPNWLNLEAEKADINVSKVLQEALMSRLNVSK